MESEKLNGDMNFESYRRSALEEYKKLRPLSADFVECVKNILKASLNRKKLVVASIEGRAINLDSVSSPKAPFSSTNMVSWRYVKALCRKNN